MTDAGDGFSLLRRGGRQERTGATEQEPVELALAELIQKISAQDDGAAPTAGPSGVDVLSLQIEDQHAAVGVPVLQVDSNLVELVQEDLLAHLAQVTIRSKSSGAAPRSSKWERMVSKALGAMAAPMLLASVIPRSTMVPTVAASTKGPSPLLQTSAAPEPVTVH